MSKPLKKNACEHRQSYGYALYSQQSQRQGFPRKNRRLGEDQRDRRNSQRTFGWSAARPPESVRFWRGNPKRHTLSLSPSLSPQKNPPFKNKPQAAKHPQYLEIKVAIPRESV